MADNGTLYGIHDKPDIMIDALDLDISLIGGKGIRGFVVVVEGELGYNCGGGMNIPRDHAMGDGNAVNVKHNPLRLTERQTAVDHIGKTEAEDMGGKLAEAEIHAFSRDRGKVHLEKVSHKFPVDVVELEPVRMRVIFSAVLRGKRGKRVFVELAVLADALVNSKTLAVSDPCKRVAAVRALKEKWNSRLPLEEAVIAYLA
jgi:hypothetical protein